MNTHYDFDEIIPRTGTDSIKLDRVADACGTDDLIPMWVADMDFRTPPFVFNAIQRRLGQGILGYTAQNKPYYDAICRWNSQQYGMEVEREQVCYVPGVVSAIHLAVHALTQRGDKVLIMEPVYHPFRLVPEACDRQVVMSPLIRTETSFAIDFDRLKEDLKGCRLMILCNPHNPGGVRWEKEELQRVAELCQEAGVTVISDEIHCDMPMDGRRHVPFATVSPIARKISITLQAPTKCFNLPGIVVSHAIVFDEDLRARFFNYIWGTDQDLGNVFACDCLMACYSDEGANWRDQMLAYIKGNIQLLKERLEKECPAIVPIIPQYSYLVFLDCRGLGFETQEELEQFFAFKAKVGLNSGSMFGPSGQGYMRMNMGSPRSIVNEAIDRIVAAANSLSKRKV